MNPIIKDNYFCDVESHIFNNKIYLYGSHDARNSDRYCPLDYICYSANLNDLSNWHYEGVIYRKDQDPLNHDNKHDLYAPDVVCGNDGKYYLYYGLSNIDMISIARSDKPNGPFEYYGTIRYPNNIDFKTLDIRPYHFDPSVINDNGKIILSLGFSVDANIPAMDINEHNDHGLFIVELEDGMQTMKTLPKLVIPGYKYGKNTSFEDHEFLEAASLRKYNDTYYLLYSSKHQHELCYATSKYFDHGYEYQGILISNASKTSDDDIYKNNYANNHGSLLQINDDYYIFYHRHTYAKQYSRQVCMEKIKMIDGHFITQEITSSSLYPLSQGCYDASIACELYDNNSGIYIDFFENGIDRALRCDDKITNITNTTIVYRYFQNIHELILDFDKTNCHLMIYQDDHLIFDKQVQNKTANISLLAVNKPFSITIIIEHADKITLNKIITK